LNVRDATTGELADWDARAVDAPGGHVYQSRAWAEHRAASGWTPRFLATDDGGLTLALTRDWVLVPGGSAYVTRGPVVMGADPTALAARQVGVADALAADGIDVVAADPEVPASDGDSSRSGRSWPATGQGEHSPAIVGDKEPGGPAGRATVLGPGRRLVDVSAWIVHRSRIPVDELLGARIADLQSAAPNAAALSPPRIPPRRRDHRTLPRWAKS
jgi:hypothetical protein